MTVTNSDIDAIKRDISKTAEALDSLCADLGRSAYAYHSELGYSPSAQCYENLSKAISEKKQIDEKIGYLRQTIDLVDNGGSEIFKSETSIRKIASDIDTLVSSLGAIAYEVYHSGTLDDGLLQFMKPLQDYDERVEKLTNQLVNAQGKVGKVVIEKQLSFYKSRSAKIFHEVGTSLLSCPYLENLSSARAKEIVDQIHSLESKQVDVSNQISQKASAISSAQSSLKDMGILGEENKTLKELDQKSRKMNALLGSLYLEYGASLAAGMDTWLVPSTEATLQEFCRRIRTEQTRLEKQRCTHEFLLAERQMSIHLGQIEQLGTQLEHLEQQKELVEKQIADLKEKIASNREASDVLKKKEFEIRSRAMSLGTGDLL